MQGITKPEEVTYFIAYTDTEIFSYGKIDVTQSMSTGQPHLWTTPSELEWKDRLLSDFNCDISENDNLPA
jgi:hypothetical protein